MVAPPYGEQWVLRLYQEGPYLPAHHRCLILTPLQAPLAAAVAQRGLIVVPHGLIVALGQQRAQRALDSDDRQPDRRRTVRRAQQETVATAVSDDCLAAAEEVTTNGIL